MAQTDTTNNKLSEQLNIFYGKDSVTILITDSGLGGLSVFAEIDKNIRLLNPFKKVNLIFVNALPNENFRYNAISSSVKKAKIFSSALTGMNKLYKPDIILIACNTLSVIYNKTDFSINTNIPVISIVNYGVEMVFEQLKKKTNSTAILLGTPTTINENKHKQLLISKGIDSTSIITQGCDMLESEIQNNPKSDMVESMIEMYAYESLENKIIDSSKVYIALFCTHYGYSNNIFNKIYSEQLDNDVIILNPNNEMAKVIFPKNLTSRFNSTNISLEVTSQAKILKEAINSIGNILKLTSPQSFLALKKYNYNKNIFSY